MFQATQKSQIEKLANRQIKKCNIEKIKSWKIANFDLSSTRSKLLYANVVHEKCGNISTHHCHMRTHATLLGTHQLMCICVARTRSHNVCLSGCVPVRCRLYVIIISGSGWRWQRSCLNSYSTVIILWCRPPDRKATKRFSLVLFGAQYFRHRTH